jgi:4-amino-4-deoxy-L-arabinose transferase-like glycosyltransferase
MPTTTRNSYWLTLAGLSLMVILGGFLRLHSLGEKSVTHVEMYVPGIRLPHGISMPEERLSLLKVVTSTLNSDTHPPAYYMMMWAWTKLFGTSAWSMRLPSALLGTACIPLVFWLGKLTRQTAAGWIAAALMAVNGHQVFWSQIARMFTLACFLGLLATILLLQIAKETRASRSRQVLYVAVLLVGLCTHVFFWLILAAHMLWTLLNGWSQRHPLPCAARLQFLASILGSPLLASSAYQGGNTLATLSSNTLIYAREFLQFAFVFPLLGYSSGVYPDQGKILTIDDPHLSFSRWLFFLLSIFLFAAGVASVSQSKPTDGKPLDNSSGPSSKAWLLAAALATIAIMLFVWVAKTFAKPPNPTLRTSELMIVVPFLLALGAILVQRNWQRLTSWRTALVDNRFVIGDQGLVLILTVLPFLALSVISVVKPIFNARGLLPLAPYLLLVLSAGIVRVARRPIPAIALLAALGIQNYSGLKAYSHVSAGRADYKTFAEALLPQIGASDLVFLHPEFYSTPLFYYMNSNWDRVVGRDYEAAVHDKPQAKIWVLWFYNYEPELPKPMQDALSGYHVVQTVEAPGGEAVLYVPSGF